ncbi:Coiled-coil and C2 domain-containing protein 2A, partial [Quaeritorhiza haematococci]
MSGEHLIKDASIAPAAEQNLRDLPTVVLEDASLFDLQLTKASVLSNRKSISDSPTGSYQLVFDLRGLGFSEHPLMTEEIRVAKEAEGYVKLLNERRKIGVVEFLTTKLKALKDAHTQFEAEYNKSQRECTSTTPTTPSTSVYVEFQQKQKSLIEARERREKEKRLLEYLEEIRATRLLRDTEMQTDRILEFRILKLWTVIKNLRNDQGFVSSDLRILVKNDEVPMWQERDALEKDVFEELQELEQLHMLKQKIAKRLSDDENSKQATGKGDNADSDSKEKSKNQKSREQLSTAEDGVQEKLPTAQNDSGDTGGADGGGNADIVRGSFGALENEDDNANEKERHRDDGTSSRRSDKHRSRSKSVRRGDREKEKDDGESGKNKERHHRRVSTKGSKSDRNRSKSKHRGDKEKTRRKREEEREEEFDRDAARSEISKRLESCRRPPGLPTFTIFATHSEPITPIAECPRFEANRRKQIDSMHMQVRLFYNDKEITRTMSAQLDPVSFEANYAAASRRDSYQIGGNGGANQQERGRSIISKTLGWNKRTGQMNDGRAWMYPAQIVVTVREVPESIRAEIFELGVMGEMLLGEIFVPIPEPTKTVNAIDLEPLTLQYTGRPFELLKPLPKQGGSKGMNADVIAERWVSGTMTANVAWNVDKDGKPLGPTITRSRGHFSTHKIKGFADPLRTIGPGGLLNLRKLMNWIVNLQVDPNDPRNHDILRLQQTITTQPYSPLMVNQAAFFGAFPYSKRNSPPASDESWTTLHEYWQNKKFFRLQLPMRLMEAAMGLNGSQGWYPDTNQFRNKYWSKRLPMVKGAFQQPDPQSGIRFKRWELMAARTRNRGAVRGAIPLIEDEVREDVWVKTQALMKQFEKRLEWRPSTATSASKDLLSSNQTTTHTSTSENPEDSTSTEDLSEYAATLGNNASKLGFLKQIRAHQLFQQARRSRPKHVEDFVREERLPGVTDPQRSLFGAMFGFRRPLRPTRADRTGLGTSTSGVEVGGLDVNSLEAPGDLRIIVQVQKAFNVPVRRKDAKIVDAAQKRSSQHIHVRSYVEVSFQRQRGRTAVSEGPHPQWNETIILDVVPPNKPNATLRNQLSDSTMLLNSETSEANLMETSRPDELDVGDVEDDRIVGSLNTDLFEECLYLNLFDEILVDMVQDIRDRDRHIHQRRERNWLGTLSIPFTTIYERIRIDGTFRVNMPPVTLGYEKNSPNSRLDDAVLFGIDPSCKETLLTVFITLDPPLIKPGPVKFKFRTEDDERVIRLSQSLISSLSKTYPGREFLGTAIDMEGRTVFAPRFIRALNPPAGPAGETPEALLRYVSLIPHVSSRLMLGADVALWSTSDQVLEIGAGDSIEHAILLANLLLGLSDDSRGSTSTLAPSGVGKRDSRPSAVSTKSTDQPVRRISRIQMSKKDVFVLIGRGIPEGSTAYVVLRDRKPEMPPSSSTRNSNVTGRNSLGSGIRESLRGSLQSFSWSMGGTTRSQDLYFRDDNVLVMNPVSGEMFKPKEPHIPLREVWCMFNADNIWYNIQKRCDPGQVSWNLDDPASWRPFFSKQFPKPSYNSIQLDYLDYAEMKEAHAKKLEMELEKILIAKIEEWREQRVTRWNRLCSKTFKTMISRFEDKLLSNTFTPHDTKSLTASVTADLQPLQTVYQICGFSLNLPFTDVGAVVGAVQGTDVHSNIDPTVEFAVATHCVGYPGR